MPCDFTDSGECASVTGAACICAQPAYQKATMFTREEAARELLRRDAIYRFHEELVTALRRISSLDDKNVAKYARQIAREALKRMSDIEGGSSVHT
jgi:hypothetical protein